MTAPDPKDGPTQAQREAAAKAVYRAHCIRHNHRFDWEQAAQSMWTDYAIAALTAAAEVGKYPTGLDAITAFMKAQKFQEKEEEAKRINEAAGRQERALAASAEAGKYESRQPGDPLFDGAEESVLAAAEAGEPTLTNLPPEEQRKAHKWMDQQLVAATIERCAQIADEIADKELDIAQAALLRRAATALRAMKEDH